METSQIFIENCNNVSDRIYDTVRVSLDSSVSFAAIEKIQNYYDVIYSRMQTDMSNIIMVFTFILGLFTICLGVKFVWDAFVAKRWYSDRERVLKNNFDEKVKEIQKDFADLKDSYVLDSIMSYVKMGQQLYREANCQPTKEAFLQMYMALNFLLSSGYKKDFLPLYEIVIAELGNTFYYDNMVGKNLALDPLSMLKNELEDALEKCTDVGLKKDVSILPQKTANEDICGKIKDIIAKIDSILNRMEADSDMDHGDVDDESDHVENADSPEKMNENSITPIEESELVENTGIKGDGDAPPLSEGVATDKDLANAESLAETPVSSIEKSESDGKTAESADTLDNTEMDTAETAHLQPNQIQEQKK